MFEVKKSNQKPLVIIRSASGYELSMYEKRKLASVEENAQENKIESIRINDERLPIDSVNKEVVINLGSLANKDSVGPKELSRDELFLINCELSDSDLLNGDI